MLTFDTLVMSGLECVKILRQRHPSTTSKIYFVTGYERSSIDEEYLNMVNGLLMKPLRLKTVKDILSYCVNENCVQEKDEKTSSSSVESYNDMIREHATHYW